MHSSIGKDSSFLVVEQHVHQVSSRLVKYLVVHFVLVVWSSIWSCIKYLVVWSSIWLCIKYLIAVAARASSICHISNCSSVHF